MSDRMLCDEQCGDCDGFCGECTWGWCDPDECRFQPGTHCTHPELYACTCLKAGRFLDDCPATLHTVPASGEGS